MTGRTIWIVPKSCEFIARHNGVRSILIDSAASSVSPEVSLTSTVDNDGLPNQLSDASPIVTLTESRGSAEESSTLRSGVLATMIGSTPTTISTSARNVRSFALIPPARIDARSIVVVCRGVGCVHVGQTCGG